MWIHNLSFPGYSLLSPYILIALQLQLKISFYNVKYLIEEDRFIRKKLKVRLVGDFIHHTRHWYAIS